MGKKSCFIFDIVICFLLIVLCQTVYRVHQSSNQSFVPLFFTVVREDTFFVKKELSRFFLYLSNVLKPQASDAASVPPLLTQLDELVAQLTEAYQATHDERYNAQERAIYQQEISALLQDIELTAHAYLKQRTSARLLAPQGLSSHITAQHEGIKDVSALTERTQQLVKRMNDTLRG